MPLKRNKPLRRTPLKRVSNKRRKEMAQYSVLREDFMKHNPMCRAWLMIDGRSDEEIKNIQEIAVIALWQGWEAPSVKTLDVVRMERLNLPSHCPRSFDLHHSKKRGRHYLDVSSWMAVSRSLHQRIHDNPGWARENCLLA